MIADIIDEKMEFRHQGVNPMTTRNIQDYEYKTLLKKIHGIIESFKAKCHKRIKIQQSNCNNYGRLFYETKKGCNFFYKTMIFRKIILIGTIPRYRWKNYF